MNSFIERFVDSFLFFYSISWGVSITDGIQKVLNKQKILYVSIKQQLGKTEIDFLIHIPAISIGVTLKSPLVGNHENSKIWIKSM